MCSDHHEEIVYEGRKCPLCDTMEQQKDNNEEIEGLQKTIDDLRFDLKECECQTCHQVRKLKE